MAEPSAADFRRRAAIESWTPPPDVRAKAESAQRLLNPGESLPVIRVFPSAEDAFWYMPRFPLPPGSVLYIPGDGAFVQMAAGEIAWPVDIAARAAGSLYPGAIRVAQALAGPGPVVRESPRADRHPAAVAVGQYTVPVDPVVHRSAPAAGISAADLPDDAHVNEQTREFIDVPGTRYCSDPGELRSMMEKLSARTGGGIERHTIEKELSEAESCAAAAQALTYRNIRFGLQIRPGPRGTSPDGTPIGSFGWNVITEFRNPAWPVTKLGYACLVAAGKQSGLNDRLRELGYRDSADVAARASSYNARTGSRLPVPGQHAERFRPGHDPAVVPGVAIFFDGHPPRPAPPAWVPHPAAPGPRTSRRGWRGRMPRGRGKHRDP